MTIFATVISGVLVFVLGQIMVKFVIDPIKELKEVLGEIQFSLIFHAQAIYTLVGDRDGEDAAQIVIRDLASKLRAKTEVIPLSFRVFSASLREKFEGLRYHRLPNQ